MGTLLVIDAATPACSVALFDCAHLVAGDYQELGRGHAERLVPMIAALPGKGRADAIAVNCGPGSFTGIRVGLSAAQALAIAWNVPVNGYSTTALMAQMVAQDAGNGPIAIVMLAGHGEVFHQNFDINNRMASVESGSAIISLPPEKIARAIAGRAVYGSGTAMLEQSGITIHASPQWPDARAFPATSTGFASLSSKPIYIRAPDAKPAARQRSVASKASQPDG